MEKCFQVRIRQYSRDQSALCIPRFLFPYSQRCQKKGFIEIFVNLESTFGREPPCHSNIALSYCFPCVIPGYLGGNAQSDCQRREHDNCTTSEPPPLDVRPGPRWRCYETLYDGAARDSRCNGLFGFIEPDLAFITQPFLRAFSQRRILKCSATFMGITGRPG